MIAQVIAGSGSMTLTSVQFGSGFPASGDNIPNYTALKTTVMNGQITGANNVVQSQTTIRVNISSANAPITFQVNEIGVFAQLGAAPPLLFAYASTGGPTGDTVTPSSPASAIVKDYALLILFTQNVPSATNITLQQVVGLHASTHILPGGIDPLPLPSTSSDGLCPANPNDGTQLLSGTNPPSWTPGLLVIRANITLYVSTTGNNSTAKPNNPALPWLTIQGALNYLIPYFIEPGALVTISVAAGTYSSSIPIIVNHPQGQNIQIVGTNSATANSTSASVTVGGVVSLTTSAGGWTSAGISATGFIISSGLSTQNGIVESGVYPLLSNNGTTLTYSSGGVSPSGVTFNVTQLKTVLQFSAGVQGIIISGNGLGLLSSVLVQGNASGSTPINGIQVTGGATVNCNFVGMYGWKDSSNISSAGASVYAGLLICSNCYSTNNTNGFLSNGFGASLSCVTCQSNYNFRGYWSNSSSISLYNCNACGNVDTGSLAVGNATIGMAGTLQCLMLFNGIGAKALQLSSIIVSSQGSTVFANNTTDLILSILSCVARIGPNGIVYTTKSANIIANNTLTADGCYVSP